MTSKDKRFLVRDDDLNERKGSGCANYSYQPNLWDYHSLCLHSTSPPDYKEKSGGSYNNLRKQATDFLHKKNELVIQLELVDALQNLGLAYQFQKEINNLLGTISVWHDCTSLAEDLHATALLFRLLRENGFQVSEDIFNAFEDDKGQFKECFSKDPKSMLSLYEASHLDFEGEEMLEKARILTIKYLNELKPYVDPELKKKIDHALDLPLHWRSTKMEVKWHIEIYEKENKVPPLLLELAKLDFNMAQNTYQDELKRVARWWTDLGIAKKLCFARDRLVECYFFATGVVPQPSHGYCREAMTKVGNLILILDDVYDIYGSLDELILFSNAIDSWDIKEIKEFPEYLKTCFTLLYDTTNEIANHIRSKDGIDILSCLQKTWVNLCFSYLAEAKWHSTGNIPTLQEYLENGWISVSGHLILSHIFYFSIGLNEDMECLDNYLKPIYLSSMIFRLCNDLATSSVEIERGDAPTSIMCYMNDHDVTEEVARKEIKRLVSDTWKKLNKEIFRCEQNHQSLLTAAINLARIAQFTYYRGDGIGAPDEEMMDQIRSTFLDPIILRKF